MKIRIKFRKYGIMKFIGHLDIMRYFQKAMRRADIDICYSAGFSPHMIMSFASPLGVGLTSDGEYLDIEIGNELSSEAAVKRLNRVMAEGVEVLSFQRIPEEKSANAMSLVAAADYECPFPGKQPACGLRLWKWPGGKMGGVLRTETDPGDKKDEKRRAGAGFKTIDLRYKMPG